MNSRDLTIVLLVILGVVVLLPVLGMSMWGFGGMMGPAQMGRGMMGGWGGGGLLFLVLIIVGVFLIARGLLSREARGEDPVAILKQRLARGEITKEQFEDLKQALK